MEASRSYAFNKRPSAFGIGDVLLSVFLTLCLVARGVHSDNCTAEQVLACIAPVQDGISEYGNATQQSMNQSCGAFSGIVPCMTAAGCHTDEPNFRLSFMGAEDGLRYICTEGMQGFLKGQDCLATHSYSSEQLDCYITFSSAILDFPTNICNSTNAYLACRMKTIDRHCTKEFTQIYTTYIVKVTKTALNRSNCTVDSSLGLNDAANQHSTASLLSLVLTALLGTAMSLCRNGLSGLL